MENLIEFKDKIKSLKQNPTGYQIIFQTHAGVYYLKQSNPNFKSLELALKQFEILKMPLKVIALSTSLEIQTLTP